MVAGTVVIYSGAACSKDVGAKRTKLGIAGLIRDQWYRTAFDNDADAGLTKLTTGQEADAGLFLGICQHHKVTLTPQTAAYGRAECIPVHHRQHGRALYKPVQFL
jgi:hypothetical protein